MRGAYIDYSMSVIVSRALPDVRDGLKPVHRRVLYAMDGLGVNYNKAPKKSARIVGECLGKYHPHGDASVYDAMVRMAQDWSLRYPLVDGQGNFGSIDGDSPAAMRYTEVRLKRLAEELLADLEKNTVAFQPNFDDSLEEPTVLPAKFPNLLVNGTSGIAVGMATNMAPHNLSEVIDAITAYIENPDITIPELCHFVKGPDFPTGAIIYGTAGVRAAAETGRGRIVIRSSYHTEEMSAGRERLVFTDVPYMVNKANMVEKIGAMINDKQLEGISDLRDESDREGIRVVFDLRKDANTAVVVNNLYKHTALQSTFGVNNVALVNGRPILLNLKDLIKHFVEHRHEVVVRRTEFDLAEARKRAHILEGLLIALDNLDEVIRIIRASQEADEARTNLIDRFGLTEIQARAILDMRLQRLTGLERLKLEEEYAQVMSFVADCEDILASLERRMSIIKAELTEIKARYGDARRTEIQLGGDEFSMEDLIEDEEMVITVSHLGYIKRTALAEYRMQGRGGFGSKAVSTKDDDFTEHVFVATMHNYLLIFMESGRLYWQKVYTLPEGSKISKGRPLQNLMQIEPGDKLRAVLVVESLSDPDYLNNHYIVMCTEQGIIKKTTLEAFSRPRAAGIFAITVNDGDRLLDISCTDGNSDVIIAKQSGKAIRFNEGGVRPMGRQAAGVKGITLEHSADKVVGMVTVSEADRVKNLLVLSENGFGKRSSLEDYPIINRGGKGVKTLNITEKTGPLVKILLVDDSNQIMIINKSGISIRLGLDQLRIVGRNTQGVRMLKINDGDAIASVAMIENEELPDLDTLSIVVSESSTDRENTENLDNILPDIDEAPETEA